MVDLAVAESAGDCIQAKPCQPLDEGVVDRSPSRVVCSVVVWQVVVFMQTKSCRISLVMACTSQEHSAMVIEN